jgi:predicted Ser/Thr protein kinase
VYAIAPTQARAAWKPERMKEFAIGEVIADRYRVEGILGRGGMGIVYAGRDNVLDREVAIKTISLELTDGVIQEFEEEAKATAKLNNRHVVTVYDAGKHRGVPYLLMERLHGQDLEMALAREGPFEPERAVTIMLEVCHAIGAAHAFEIFHRDLSSKNVFLTSDEAKVLDFGVARLGHNPRRTEKGFIRGTWHYVPPERFQEEDRGALGDVYAIGVLLYEALTGSIPFVRRTDKTPLTGEALQAAISAGNFVAPEELRPDLAPDLTDIIRRAMARTPDDRYPSVHLLGRALLPFAPGIGRKLTAYFAGPEPVVQKVEVLTGRNRSVDDILKGPQWVLSRDGERLEALDELAESVRLEEEGTVHARYGATTAKAGRGGPGVSQDATAETTSNLRPGQRLSTSERLFAGTKNEAQQGPRRRVLAVVLGLTAGIAAAAIVATRIGAEKNGPRSEKTQLPASAADKEAAGINLPKTLTPDAATRTAVTQPPIPGNPTAEKPATPTEPAKSVPARKKKGHHEAPAKQGVRYEDGVPLLRL